MLAASFVLALGAFASPVMAQRSDDAGMQKSQNPCVGDAYKFCNAEIPDRAKVASCLFKHKAQLRLPAAPRLAAARRPRRGARVGITAGVIAAADPATT